MIKHNLDQIYIDVAKELGVSTQRVKNVVNDVFSQVREFLSSPTEYDQVAILLNKLGTIEIDQKVLKHHVRELKHYELIDKDDTEWESLYERVQQYHNTKKLKYKRKQQNERERIDTPEESNYRE